MEKTIVLEIQNMFEEQLNIGQPIYITSIYDKLNNLDEIVDVTNVEITNEIGDCYFTTCNTIELM